MSGGGTGEPTGPDAIHLKAQDRATAAGGKLADQEKVKRELHPFDAYGKLRDQAENNEAPKPADNFRWRYFGLFYVAPTQTSYMCRLRIANGILSHWQLSGLADVAEKYAAPYSHVTTRANLQLREIEPKNATNVVETIQDLGLCSRGSGADNIRNVTGTPTAGIDPQELLDTRPYAREWHHHILNDRSLYGLPRKFNVAFDGAGKIAVLEDTNDIGFQAVEVKEGFGVEPGIYFRLTLGGITGHKDFARDTGVILKPSEATAISDAIVRVFIEHGDRTNRNKARLKYVLDAWGFDKFLTAVEEKLGRTLLRVSGGGDRRTPGVRSRGAYRRASAEAGGPVLDRHRAAGRQDDDRADARRRQGRRVNAATAISVSRSGRTCCISGVPTDRIAQVEAEIAALGLVDESNLDPRRSCGLHRRHRLPLCRRPYQGERGRDRALVRGARAAR